MRLLRSALAALLLLPLSGCLSDGGGSDDASDTAADVLAPFVNPINLTHEHSDLSLHQISNNIELVGHDSMGDNGPPGGLGEIDVAGDYAFVAVFDHGFAIMDISDPTDPEMVSLFELPTPAQGPFGHYTADLKVDGTGDWVFLGMELSPYAGVVVVDTRDKANPQFAGFWPAPGALLGCHMVEYAVISEQEYVFCAPLDNAVYVGLLAPPAGPTREIATVARWVPNSAGYVESEVGHVQEDPQGFPSRYVVSGHQDMTYMEDPLDGTPTLWVSFWNLGLRIVDVSIPAAPLEIGFWDGAGASDYRGNFHTAMAFKSEEGKRIAIAIPEVTSPPTMFILDATDIANPVLLGQWKALDDFEGQDGAFSLHNFQIVGGKVYIAMGHGGIWVLDVSTPEYQANPKPLGSYYPHAPRPDGQDYAIYPWDVNVHEGYMLNAEGNGGFYVLHFLGDPAGDERHNSFA